MLHYVHTSQRTWSQWTLNRDLMLSISLKSISDLVIDSLSALPLSWQQEVFTAKIERRLDFQFLPAKYALSSRLSGNAVVVGCNLVLPIVSSLSEASSFHWEAVAPRAVVVAGSGYWGSRWVKPRPYVLSTTFRLILVPSTYNLTWH